MIGLNIDLSSLGFKKENMAFFACFLILLAVLYHFQSHINKDIKSINGKLDNHITEIETEQKETNKKIDTLDSKFDSRFDNLINILLSNKIDRAKDD